MTPRLRRRRARGFTLLEVIVALGILGVIAALSFSTIYTALQTRDALEATDATEQAARIAMERLRRDLSLAWLTTKNQAAVATYQTVFIGRDNPDVLWFSTLSHRRLVRNSREGDQTEITLWLEDDPNTPGAYVLMHREAPRIDQYPDKDGAIYPLAYGVKEFTLRYLDTVSGEWKDEWDTTGTETPSRLPRAVEVTLILLSPNLEEPGEFEERTYYSQILLTLADPMQPKQPATESSQ